MKQDTKDILAHLGALIILTIPFWVFNLDLDVQRIFYDFQTAKWYLNENPAVIFIYKFGVYPGLALTAAAAAVFGLGFTYEKLAKYRKTAALIVLTMLIGPAFIINVGFKAYAGRPRPREVKEFNGDMAYRHVFEFGAPGSGYSFPCGHCSTGFLFAALYFAYRKKNKLIAVPSLCAGLAWGGLLGATRMAQGAHFLSDVLWAGGITVITAEVVYYKILGGGEEGWFDRAASGVSGKAGIYATAALLAALAVAALVATPYSRQRDFSTDIKAGDIVDLKMDIEGEVRINRAPAGGLIHIQASGFGFPTRDFDGELKETAENGVKKLEFRTIKKGFFSELNASVDVSLPPAKEYRITVNDKKGDINCSITGDSPEIALTTGKGNIGFTAGSFVKDVLIVARRGDARIVFGADTKPAKRAFIDIKAAGDLEFTDRSAYFTELKAGSAKINGAKELYYKSRKKDGPEMSLKAGRIIIK